MVETKQVSSKISNKVMMFTFAICIQHNIGNTSSVKQTNKKEAPTLGRRSNIIFYFHMT
jgi:hypothetical protein